MPPDAAAQALRETAARLRAEAAVLDAEADRIAAEPLSRSREGGVALTTQQAADRSGVPPATLRRWAKTRAGLAIHDGREWRFSAAEVARLAAARVSADRGGR